jgi:tetratricopeptide (TPR) repeat protein
VRRRASFGIWIGLAVGLAILQAPMTAQENGHGTRPASRSAAPDTRNSASRPATDLERSLVDLRKSQTIASAALSARAVYGLGDDGRKALLDLCREKTLPDATFQGVVGAFEFERDASILPVLIDLYGLAGGARDRYLKDRFRAFDAQRSMLDDIFVALEKSKDPRRRTLFRVLADIVDTPAERMQAARFLVQAFQRAEFQGYSDDLASVLQKITLQRHTQPARWQKWLDEFAAAHPEGFTEAELYESALAERDQRFIAEVKRSITIAVASKQIPDYFNVVQYPEPAIRAHAAQELGGLKEAELDIIKQAVKVLLDALKVERDDEVICSVLKSLGTLAEAKDDLKEEIGPRLVPYLNDERDGVVVAALKAIAQTGTGTDCHAVEKLYVQPEASGPDRSGVRAQVVTTLYSLDCGSPMIVAALEDGSPEVRASAARGLGYGKEKKAAPKIAKALSAEKNEETQRVMVSALIAIQDWPSTVVDALLEVAGKPGTARHSAVRGLIQAASSGTVDSARAERLVTVVSEALPTLSGVPDKKKALIEEFQNAKGDLAVQALRNWLENEAQPETARELAAILIRIAKPAPEVLQGYAASLMTAGRPAAAIVLLRGALDHGNEDGSATKSVRPSDLKIALARALLLEKLPEGLVEAEGIASQELRLKPEDGQLLLLRGAIREAMGRRFEAAEDLRRALKTEGVVMADPQRQEAERRTALLLLAEDPRKAKEFLDGLPPLPRDRDFLIVQGRVAIANGEWRPAIAQLRSALKAPGKEEPNVVRYHLARALLASCRADDHLEAKSLFEALEGEPPMPDGYPLQPLREDVRADLIARKAVSELDESSADRVSSNLLSVISLGESALPWLFHQLPELAKTAPLPTLERRITAVHSIMAPATESRPAPPTPPTPGASREAWIEFASHACQWWDQR